MAIQTTSESKNVSGYGFTRDEVFSSPSIRIRAQRFLKKAYGDNSATPNAQHMRSTTPEVKAPLQRKTSLVLMAKDVTDRIASLATPKMPLATEANQLCEHVNKKKGKYPELSGVLSCNEKLGVAILSLSIEMNDRGQSPETILSIFKTLQHALKADSIDMGSCSVKLLPI